MSLTKDFEQALEGEESMNGFNIESRRCTSDEFDGTQYNFYGDFVSIRPIIDTVAEADGKAIEQLFLVDEVDEPYIGVFVADIPEQTHPAFIN